MKRSISDLLTVTLCLLTLFPITLSGQEITISEELPLRNDYAYTLLGWVENDLLLFRDRGHSYYIQAFDEELHIKWEHEIILGDRKADIIDIVAERKRFHVIYGMKDKGDYMIYHRRYRHNLELEDSMVICQIPKVFLSPRIGMRISEDKKQIVLFREDNNVLELTGYDLSRRITSYQHQIDLAGSHLARRYNRLQVSNAGDFYLPLEPDRFLQKTQSLEVFSSVGEESILHEVISLGEHSLYDFFATYDNLHRHLVITGLYSQKMIDRADGFYFVKYQPGIASQLHILPFQDSLVADVLGRDVNNMKGLSDFNVQQVALRQDGGAVIIAELNKEFSRRSSLPLRRDNGSFTRGGWVDYYYEDLILFAIHPDGTLHWNKVLRKRQYSQDDDAIYSSFFLFRTPEVMRFLFNDEIKQENTVGGYEVTGTGDVERKTVFNTDYQRLKLRFKEGLQLAYNECIVPSERNNRLSLVRIVYED